MTDKVQKIREEVERLMNELIQEKEKGFDSDIDDACILELQNVLTFIDSLQEEPISEQNLSSVERIGKDWKEEPVSEDFKKFEEQYLEKEKDEIISVYDRHAGLVDGAQWQKKQFEKNRLAACDRQTEEEAEMERDFCMGIIENEHRQPTFDDAIKYGMRLQKKQMMAKAIDARCFGFQDAALFSFRLPVGNYLVGSEVKVIVIKED
jgi:hypothetical protein